MTGRDPRLPLPLTDPGVGGAPRPDFMGEGSPGGLFPVAGVVCHVVVRPRGLDLGCVRFGQMPTRGGRRCGCVRAVRARANLVDLEKNFKIVVSNVCTTKADPIFSVLRFHFSAYEIMPIF